MATNGIRATRVRQKRADASSRVPHLRGSVSRTDPRSADRATPTPDLAAEPQPTPTRRAHVSRAARRTVIERDGLGCSWVGEDGVRCGSQAWLEFDHRAPAGKGGSSAPDNVRLLCRAHNGLSAEQHYGRKHISRAIRRKTRRLTPKKSAISTRAETASGQLECDVVAGENK
jgi:hypothetical protein